MATNGKVSIVHATKGSLSGFVYAELYRGGSAKQASLNGTWHCRVEAATHD